MRPQPLSFPLVVHSVFSFIRFVGGFVASMYRFVFSSESAILRGHANALFSIFSLLLSRINHRLFDFYRRQANRCLPLPVNKIEGRKESEELIKTRSKRKRRDRWKEREQCVSDFSARIPSQPTEASEIKKSRQERTLKTGAHHGPWNWRFIWFARKTKEALFRDTNRDSPEWEEGQAAIPEL